MAFVKGAPDMILEICDQIIENGKPVAITEEKKKEVLGINQDMARQALRVLGVAYRPMNGVPAECTCEIVEKNLTFVGLMGMIDPARPEVKEAVKIAQGAGLKSVMVTGDYKDTAEAIAKEIGLLTPGGKVLDRGRIGQDERRGFGGGGRQGQTSAAGFRPSTRPRSWTPSRPRDTSWP